MIPRSLRDRAAIWLALIAACLLCLLQPGCQDGEVSSSQVCAFQCDYTQNGTEVGYPAAAAGVARVVWLESFFCLLPRRREGCCRFLCPFSCWSAAMQ